MSKNLFDLSSTTSVADSSIGSLLASYDMVPSQWANMHRRKVQSGELQLLWGVFFGAWEDLRSPRDRIRTEAECFFTRADAGHPLSLRYLCEVFDLDLEVVQAVARARLAAGLRKGARRRP
jgi:hypothetical protein